MGIIDRIKRRLPILAGAPAPSTRAPTATARPLQVAEEDEPIAHSPRGDKPVAAYIEDTVKGNPVVLFMKGSPASPQCGFSAGATGILASYGKPFAHVDVLSDPDVREGVKQYTNWPTIPQVFVGGEFIGGADILKQMHENGELAKMIKDAYPAS